MLLWASYVCGLTWCPGLLRWFTLLNGFMADYVETRRLFAFHAVEVVVQNRLRLVYAWQSACQFHLTRGQNMTKNPVPTDTVTIFSQPLPVTSGKPETGSKPVSSWQKQYQNREGPFWDHSWVPVLHHEVPTGIHVYLCLRRSCKITAVSLSTPLMAYFITPLAHDLS